AAERARDVDRTQRRPSDVGKQQRRPARIALLDDDVVAPQSQRIARHLQGDVVIAAETQFGRGIQLTLRKIRRELDSAGGQDVARYRDDRGPRGDLARLRLHRDIAAAPGDTAYRR